MADETQAERPTAERHEWGASEETNAPFFAIQNDGGHLWFWEGEDGMRVDAIIGGAFLAPAARELLRVVAERDEARARERERVRKLAYQMTTAADVEPLCDACDRAGIKKHSIPAQFELGWNMALRELRCRLEEPERCPVADERHEWKDGGRNLLAIEEGFRVWGMTGEPGKSDWLPIEPQWVVKEIARELLRLAAREREQRAWIERYGTHHISCISDQSEAARAGRSPECTCGLAALLASPDAQKAAGEITCGRRFGPHRCTLPRGHRDYCQEELEGNVPTVDDEAELLRADNKALRAEVEDLTRRLEEAEQAISAHEHEVAMRREEDAAEEEAATAQLRADNETLRAEKKGLIGAMNHNCDIAEHYRLEVEALRAKLTELEGRLEIMTRERDHFARENIELRTRLNAVDALLALGLSLLRPDER